MSVVGGPDVQGLKPVSNVTVVSCRRFSVSVVGGTVAVLQQ